jgi:hypothetical protein
MSRPSLPDRIRTLPISGRARRPLELRASQSPRRQGGVFGLNPAPFPLEQPHRPDWETWTGEDVALFGDDHGAMGLELPLDGTKIRAQFPDTGDVGFHRCKTPMFHQRQSSRDPRLTGCRPPSHPGRQLQSRSEAHRPAPPAVSDHPRWSFGSQPIHPGRRLARMGIALPMGTLPR